MLYNGCETVVAIVFTIVFVIASVVSETTDNRVRSAGQSHTAVVRSSSSSSAVSVHVTLPSALHTDIPHITCDNIATATSVGRLSTLPPPHRGAVTQSAVTRSHSLRSTDRRCGVSNVVKRHSTSSVTTSPSSSCDGSRPQPRRSALLLPPTWNAIGTDVHR